MLRQPWNHTLFLHIGTASNIDNQISQILPVPVGNSRWIMQMQKENQYPRIRPAFLCSARLQLAVEYYHSTHGKQHAYISAPVKKFRNNIYILKGNGGEQERLFYSMLHKIRELLKNLFRIDLATHQALLPSKLWMSFPAIPAERSGTPEHWHASAPRQVPKGELVPHPVWHELTCKNGLKGLLIFPPNPALAFTSHNTSTSEIRPYFKVVKHKIHALPITGTHRIINSPHTLEGHTPKKQLLIFRWLKL